MGFFKLPDDDCLQKKEDLLETRHDALCRKQAQDNRRASSKKLVKSHLEDHGKEVYRRLRDTSLPPVYTVNAGSKNAPMLTSRSSTNREIDKRMNR